MEFERAIYRVYEKCLEGLREDDPDSISPRSCRLIETMVLGTAIFLLFSLCYLHYTFVGSSGCLPYLLSQQPNPFTYEYQTNNSLYFSESIMSSNLTALNLRSDQILQVDVKGSFMSSIETMSDGSEDQAEEVSIVRGIGNSIKFLSHSIYNYPTKGYIDRGYRYYKSSFFNIFNVDLSVLNGTNSPPNQNSNQNPSHRLRNGSPTKRSQRAHGYDYEFAYNIGLLTLSEEVRWNHHFKSFNVTLSGSECFGGPLTMTLLPLGGIDTVVKNFIQNTFQREGGALISAVGDYYTWTKLEISMVNFSFIEKFNYKIMVLIMSCFSFFFVSTITALLVRILISSGVVILFPMFWMIQRAGVSAISWRLVSLSYPWVGVPIEILRARNQSAMPFVLAHIMRIIVYYSLYEAAQFAFSSWFFGEVRPGQRELWLFAIMMLLEYYSMIYIRARASITIFPRYCFALYLLFHFYVYCQPSGFHLLAILVMFMFYLWMMIFCVRKYELEAFTRGHISIDHPRVLHNSIPWPVWSISLAPDFTLFWPLDSESTSIYGQPTDAPITREELNSAATDPSNQRDDGNDLELGGMGQNSDMSSVASSIDIGYGSHNEYSSDISSRVSRRSTISGDGNGDYSALPTTYHHRGEISPETTSDFDSVDSPDENHSFPNRRNLPFTSTLSSTHPLHPIRSIHQQNQVQNQSHNQSQDQDQDQGHGQSISSKVVTSREKRSERVGIHSRLSNATNDLGSTMRIRPIVN